MLRIVLTVTLAALVVAAPADLDPNHADEGTEEVVQSKRAADNMGPSWHQLSPDQQMQMNLMMQQRAADQQLYNDQTLLMQQRAANQQQMYYQPERAAIEQIIMQQRAAYEANNQMLKARQNEEQSMAASSMSPSSQMSNQELARSAYGAAAAPVHPAIGGGAVGVFPSQLNAGGCGNAIPLLLSCTPNLVQGHVVSLGHGVNSMYAPNLGFSGLHAGSAGNSYSNYGALATAYRAAAGSPSETSQSSGAATPNDVAAANTQGASLAHAN